MTLPKSLLTAEDIGNIKADLFTGHISQKEIGRAYSVSQATISRIYRGHEYANIPWPDGSTGHIPIEIWKRHISSKRRSAVSHKKTVMEHNADPIISRVADKVSALLSQSTERDIKEAIKVRKSDNIYPSKKQAIEMLPWMDIKAQDPVHPIVLDLIKKDIPTLRVAMQIVCLSVDVKKWQSTETVAMIYETEARLRKERG